VLCLGLLSEDSGGCASRRDACERWGWAEGVGRSGERDGAGVEDNVVFAGALSAERGAKAAGERWRARVRKSQRIPVIDLGRIMPAPRVCACAARVMETFFLEPFLRNKIQDTHASSACGTVAGVDNDVASGEADGIGVDSDCLRGADGICGDYVAGATVGWRAWNCRPE